MNLKKAMQDEVGKMKAARSKLIEDIAAIDADDRLSGLAKENDKRQAREAFEKSVEGCVGRLEEYADRADAEIKMHNEAFDYRNECLIDAVRFASLGNVPEQALSEMLADLKRPAEVEYLARALEGAGLAFEASEARERRDELTLAPVSDKVGKMWFVAADPMGSPSQGIINEAQNAIEDASAVLESVGVQA